MDGQKIITVPVMSSGFAILWGIFAVNPYVDLFAKNPVVYARMGAVASDVFWGGLMIAAGSFALGFYGKGFYKIEAGILGSVFTVFAVLYAFADLSSPAWALYGFIALCNYAMLWARIWRR